MRVDSRSGRVVAEALRALAAGDGKRFDDMLWLGLGDRCAEAWLALQRGGYITDTACVFDLRLTDRGRDLLRRLGQDLQLVA